MFTRRADAAGDRTEHLQPQEIEVVEAHGEVEQLLVERRAEARVRGEPRVVHPALGEHLVEERVRLERVDAGVAAGVRQRDPDVEVPELEHGHEDHERDDRHEDRVEEERAALLLADGPLHGGTVVASVVGAASCLRTLWTLSFPRGNASPTNPRARLSSCSWPRSTRTSTSPRGSVRCTRRARGRRRASSSTRPRIARRLVGAVEEDAPRRPRAQAAPRELRGRVADREADRARRDEQRFGLVDVQRPAGDEVVGGHEREEDRGGEQPAVVAREPAQQAQRAPTTA